MAEILPYSKILKHYARDLRKEMTFCESILWTKIRRKQIHGVQFLRQKPLGPYIIDFYAKNPKLAIEVDGSQHFSGEQKEKDVCRDDDLLELEIHTLRFTNLDILHNCQGILSQLEQVVLNLLQHPPSLRSTPCQRG